MKKLDSRTLRYIAKAYGKNYAGDESDPAASEVEALEQPPADSNVPIESVSPAAPNPTVPPPPGFDGSPEANPNVNVSPETVQQAGVAPTEVKAPEAHAPDEAQSVYDKAGVPDLEKPLIAQKNAQTAAAAAEADQGKAEVEALKAEGDAFAALPTANAIAEKYKAKDDQFAKAIASNQIDPQRYLHSLGTGQKILAGIGLILGGAGGGASGQSNLAAKMIENNINRDIEAQKNEQNKNMNLWKMNREEYGNDLAANLATQNQLLTGTKIKFMQAASSAKGPIAQANAMNANALIDQKIAENRFKLSLMHPTSDSFGLDPAKKVSWLVPPDRQAKVFDEIDAAQNTTRNAPAILKAFDDAASKVHAVDFVPGMESADQKAFHALLGPTFKDVEGTVRQAAMDNMFKNTTPQFGDDAMTKATKRQAVINYMTAKSSAPTASGYGINLEEYPSTNIKGAIPVAPGAKVPGANIQTMHGVKYQQVPGGWKKIP